MRQLWYWLIGILIVLIIVCNYHVTRTVVDPRAGTVGGDVTELDIPVTYERDIPGATVDEVREAVSRYPANVLQAFVDEGWKIVVVKEIDLKGTEFEGITLPVSVGLTNFENKTIQVAPAGARLSRFTYIRTLHEMAHFADIVYGDASDSNEWKALYQKYRNDYVEFEYNGVPVNKENESDIAYATSNRWEFFASVFKDYLNQPAYLEQYYPDLFEYIDNLIRAQNNTE